MAPSKAPSSDDESDSTTSSSQSAPAVVARRGKFDDEEDEEVVDDWEEGEDSAEEREKARRTVEAKAKEEAAKKLPHKSRSERIEERREQNIRKKLEQELSDEEEDSEEDEAERRARAQENEKASDLKAAEDLFGGAGGVNPNRATKSITITDDKDPGNAIDLSSLSLFTPSNPAQFLKLRETLVPLLTANSKKPQYALFMQEFVKQLSKDLNSEQVKKVAGGLNTMANEKMKEEKAAEKGGKKSKAQKTKMTLNASRDVTRQPDTELYDDGLDDGDFM